MVNKSKANNPNSWKKWRAAGSVGTIDDAVARQPLSKISKNDDHHLDTVTSSSGVFFDFPEKGYEIHCGTGQLAGRTDVSGVTMPELLAKRIANLSKKEWWQNPYDSLRISGSISHEHFSSDLVGCSSTGEYVYVRDGLRNLAEYLSLKSFLHPRHFVYIPRIDDGGRNWPVLLVPEKSFAKFGQEVARFSFPNGVPKKYEGDDLGDLGKAASGDDTDLMTTYLCDGIPAAINEHYPSGRQPVRLRLHPLWFLPIPIGTPNDFDLKPVAELQSCEGLVAVGQVGLTILTYGAEPIVGSVGSYNRDNCTVLKRNK